METIFNRRSVRKFSDKDISVEDLTKILKAGMRAPSAGNEQSWELIVTRDRSKMREIIKSNQYAQMLEQANATIVVCGDVNQQKYPYDFWVQDCSACTQNILLEAKYLGIGSVWIGTYPVEERVNAIREIFGLPEGVIPLSVVALGYPIDEIKPMDTFNEDKIHYEIW